MGTLPLKEIPFGHWGIFTEENFNAKVKECMKLGCSEKEAYQAVLRMVPIKKWDPLCSSHIRLQNKNIGKYAGDYALISAIRYERPQGKSNKSKSKDIFEMILEGKEYAIILAKDDKSADSPFSVEPKTQKLKKSKAITLINRYPAYSRFIEPDLERLLKNELENDYTKVSLGINLVTIPTRYFESLTDAHVDELLAMLESKQSAIKKVISEAKERSIVYVPVDVFFNVGAKAGGSQRRLHSQAYIDLNQDGHDTKIEQYLSSFGYYYQSHKECLICSNTLESFLAYETDGWSLWVKGAPKRRFQITITPKEHIEDMLQLDRALLKELADILIKTFKVLDRFGNVEKDRNIVFVQRPFGYDSFFHMFIDILPFEIVGGKELMGTSRVMKSNPFSIASEVKKAMEN